MSSALTQPRFPLALFGLGAIGRMHLERAARSADVTITAVCDPSPAAAEACAAWGLPCFSEPEALLSQIGPRLPVEAAIVATPNATHAAVAQACFARGLPVLLEKPVADTLAEGERLCAAAEAAGVPVLVGHQRRHNPLVRRAKALVDGGLLGRPVSVQAQAVWLKPDSYFSAAWRRQPGGGPVLINLIHDIDLLRWLVGEIAEVQAITSNVNRGFEVEDTAAVLLRFANGALGTLTTSDCAVSPWNWDLAAGEAAHYVAQDVDSHQLCGTEASLTLPRLAVWRYRGPRGWHEELTEERTPPHRADPYLEQLRHLRAVAEGREAPLCSGRDGLATLGATLAVHDAARTRAPVVLTKESPPCRV